MWALVMVSEQAPVGPFCGSCSFFFLKPQPSFVDVMSRSLKSICFPRQEEEGI